MSAKLEWQNDCLLIGPFVLAIVLRRGDGQAVSCAVMIRGDDPDSAPEFSRRTYETEVEIRAVVEEWVSEELRKAGIE